MNKINWKEKFSHIMNGLQFLKTEDVDYDMDDEIEIEEKDVSSGGENQTELPEGNLKEKLGRFLRWRMIRNTLAVLFVICLVGGFYLYNKLHTFTNYTIIAAYPNEAVSGTGYRAVGKNIYRYNSDGVSCVNRKNEIKWSVTYNMQAPITDQCGNTMAIAEQQGNQIYVINKDGLVGNFETVLPIMKVRVSKQGVVAAVLREDDITWVNLYESDGTVIVSDKTTVQESGYPLDIALSPDGQKLAVSYLGAAEGIVNSNIVFYHFGSAGQSSKDHIVSSEKCQDMVVPEIYFLDNSTAAAITDKGYMVFNGKDKPEKTEEVTFDEEIISTFHDNDRIGFLFDSKSEDYMYRMEIYNYRGRKKSSRNINAIFDQIKIENNQILMFNDTQCSAFSISGRKKFGAKYEKTIENMFYFSEFRKYLIITPDSFDKIRIS